MKNARDFLAAFILGVVIATLVFPKGAGMLTAGIVKGYSIEMSKGR